MMTGVEGQSFSDGLGMRPGLCGDGGGEQCAKVGECAEGDGRAQLAEEAG